MQFLLKHFQVFSGFPGFSRFFILFSPCTLFIYEQWWMTMMMLMDYSDCDDDDDVVVDGIGLVSKRRNLFFLLL
jgi:hypothetical protein